jgi:hypothetical protein
LKLCFLAAFPALVNNLLVNIFVKCFQPLFFVSVGMTNVKFQCCMWCKNFSGFWKRCLKFIEKNEHEIKFNSFIDYY